MRVEKIARIHFFKTSCIGHLAQHAHDDGAIVIELINCTLINCIFTKWNRYFVKGSVTCSVAYSLRAAIMDLDLMSPTGSAVNRTVYAYSRGEKMYSLGTEMSLESEVAAFRRGYADGVADRERDEHGKSYAAGHL